MVAREFGLLRGRMDGRIGRVGDTARFLRVLAVRAMRAVRPSSLTLQVSRARLAAGWESVSFRCRHNVTLG
jgi:hypothetical protein